MEKRKGVAAYHRERECCERSKGSEKGALIERPTVLIGYLELKQVEEQDGNQIRIDEDHRTEQRKSKK